MAQLVDCLQHAELTEEERLLKCFTHQQLMKLQNWPDWDHAFDAQLDVHFKAGCIGRPILQPLLTDGQPPNILDLLDEHCENRWNM